MAWDRVSFCWLKTNRELFAQKPGEQDDLSVTNRV
jgi:hypothetical protein